jgi:hypothetical protein
MNVQFEPPPATDTDTSDAYPEDGEPAALEIEDAAAAWCCMLEPGTSDAVDGEPSALEVEDGGRNKQTGFSYFYRYNYIEIDRLVKAKNPERQARDVTSALFLLWDSLTKEEQKEWTDSAPENPYASDTSAAYPEDVEPTAMEYAAAAAWSCD